MHRRVKNRTISTPAKEATLQPSQKILNSLPFKPNSTSKQNILFSQLSQTFSTSTNHKNIFNPQHIGIDLKKQAIITQNIPIALPVPGVSRLYAFTNVTLCAFYALAGAISLSASGGSFRMDQQSIPIIIVVCLTLITYVLYILITIKCSSIRTFAIKMIGIQQFQSFFYKLKSAKTFFRVKLMGDRAKWSQKDEVKELVYQPKVVDQSGRFYPLPEVISYCKSTNKRIKTREVSKYSEQQIAYGIETNSNINNNHLTPSPKQTLLTIVLATYQKKYYFANDLSKMSYLNIVQQFFNQNQRMFDPRKPIKGYKSIEFLVDGFEEKKAYLMVTLPKNKGEARPKELQLADKNQQDSTQKLQNDSFFIVNDPNSLAVLDDDDIKQKFERIPQGLIYKNKPKTIFEQIADEKIDKQMKQSHSENEKQQLPKVEPNLQYKQEQSKYVRIFLITYWVFLIFGLGAFYEWVILKKFVKCIQVTVTKEIHQKTTDSIDGLSQNSNKHSKKFFKE